MNLDKIREQLAKSQLTKTPSKKAANPLIWKPTVGTQNIRILQNPHVEAGAFPIQTVPFYYGMKNANGQYEKFVSPLYHGDPDPIMEFCESLLTGVDKETWNENVKLVNKFRRDGKPKDESYFVPILVRGAESEGVKFWQFAKGVNAKLEKIMFDTMAQMEVVNAGSDDATVWNGDITDLKQGRDLVITYTPALDPNGKGVDSYPTTDVTLAIMATPATKDPAVLEMIKNVPNIVEEFVTPTYDELKTALGKFLNTLEVEAAKVETPTNSTSAPTAKVENSNVQTAKDIDALFEDDED